MRYGHRNEICRVKCSCRTICLYLFFAAASVHAQSAFYLGISVHLANNPTMLSRQLSVIGKVGANSVRDDVNWSSVEREKGQLAVPPGVDDLVNQARKANLQPLLILDYGNQFYDSGERPLSTQALDAFARYATFVVGHFKGRVQMYEMWNEWNVAGGKTHFGAPEDYVRFLRVVYPAVKAIDPSAVFLAGAIGGLKLEWLSAMLSAGALGSFDALSIHPYIFGGSPRSGDAWAADMLATEGVIHRYTAGRDLPLYVTEMGWPTYGGPGGTPPKEAATYLAQMFLLARTMPFLKGVWWYDFRDDGWDANNKEDSFGLVDPNLEPKPAFAAFDVVAPIVKGARGVEELLTQNPSLRALRFRLDGDNQMLALWNKKGAGQIQVHIAGGARQQILSLDADGHNAHGVGAKAEERAIEISDTPVLVRGVNLALEGVN